MPRVSAHRGRSYHTPYGYQISVGVRVASMVHDRVMNRVMTSPFMVVLIVQMSSRGPDEMIVTVREALPNRSHAQ